MELDLSFYKGKRVFVTGHTGFKGSWLCKMLTSAGAEVTGYALKLFTVPSLFDIATIETDVHSVLGDIRDYTTLKAVFDEAQPEIVFHLAAQPIVRDSYKDPIYTYGTNVMGTVNILECVRNSSCVKSILNVTTDKVYLNKEWTRGYQEEDELDGYDPYSNSKSCSELVTRSYKRSFLEKNGVKNKQELVERAHKYKEEHHMDLDDMRIGCIVLTEPFFFEKKDWINPINDWAPQIVQGKKYDTTVGEGKRVYKEVIKRLNFYTDSRYNKSMVIPKVKYYETTTKHRIGQGAFRVLVTDAYARRCAISGERALPVLQAAHIRAFSKDGLNEVNNGILLRSDIHTLFDRGYITISTDYKVMVGNRLKQDFGFCQNYYNYQDKTIYLPQNKTYYPLKEYLQWHMENVFKIRNNL